MDSPPADAFLDALRDALSPAYELVRELEGGGMSRVFVAEERALGRTVVVKVLPPDLAAGVNRDRFRREIQLAARLQHPHIVPLLSAGEASGSLWYTMPFIEGESLRERMRLLVERGERFGVREVARIVHDVVEALAYAHARGVVHRDVKPGNVLMLGNHALVTDFGVAKALSAALPHSGTTSIGLAIGTPAYMAPEQLAADPAADHRMDIYAAGLLAYELLAGGSPFAAASPQATMAAQLTRVPDPLHRLRPDVPPALSDAIMRCLEKEPANRPQTADELAAELDRAMSAGWTPTSGEREAMGAPLPGAAGASASSGPTAAIAPLGASEARTLTEVPDVLPSLPTGPRRPRSWALAGAGLGMLMVIGGAWALSRTGSQEGAAAPPLAPTVQAAPAASAPPVAAAPSTSAPAAAPGAAPGAAPAPPPTPRLTREDSLAIAAAVERRLAQEERQRRARAQRELSPAEAEALRQRAWARYADSVTDVVRRQFGPDFVREMAMAAGKAVVVRVPEVGMPPGSAAAPEEHAGPRARTSRGGAQQGQSGAGGAAGFGTTVAPTPNVHVAPSAPRVPAAPGSAPRSPIAERIAAQVSPPRPGVRRVVVLELENSTGRAEFAPMATAATAALQKRLAGREGYEIADGNATRLALAAGLRGGALTTATHAGAAVFGTLMVTSDRLTYLVQVWDARRGHPRVVRVHRPLEGDGGNVARAIEELVGDVETLLDEWVAWTDRQPPSRRPAGS